MLRGQERWQYLGEVGDTTQAYREKQWRVQVIVSNRDKEGGRVLPKVYHGQSD